VINKNKEKANTETADQNIIIDAMRETGVNAIIFCGENRI